MEKILVIEDDQDVRNSISDLLVMAGYQIANASDGQDALNVIKDFSPDLIISDIMMPKMDGYTFLKEFQKTSHSSLIPFIFLSAKTDLADIRTGMSIGADDYIVKPYKANDLLQAVKTRLNKKKKVDKTLNEIAVNISMYVPHELRTPLVAILGFTDILSDEFDTFGRNEILEVIDKIKQAGRRLHTTIEKFLVFTELELLEKDLDELNNVRKLETVSAADTIKVAALGEAQKSGRQHDLEFNLENATVKISEEHFKILITEIVANALKFSPPGSIINIDTNLTEGNFHIEIADHGYGMSAEQIANISPFIQYNRELIEHKGNGLGLAIAKKIIAIYNGNFLIKSEVNSYTAVRINLPVK